MAGVVLRTRRVAAAAMLLALSAGCLTQREGGQVDAWLHCIECSDGEADSLLALGRRKAGPLFKRLRTDLLAGPSPGRRHNVQEQFRRTYQAMQTYASDHPDDVSVLGTVEADFVRGYLENYLSSYRLRAGIGLVRVAGTAAMPVLDSAIQGHLTTPSDTLRDDVKSALLFARDSMAPQRILRGRRLDRDSV